MNEFTASNGYTIGPHPRFRTSYVLRDRGGRNLLDGWDHLNEQDMRVLREFFENQRAAEAKPWLEAKPGEVWELTVDGIASAFYPSKSLDRAFTPVAPDTGRTAVAMDSFEITAGRRIWPEVIA